MNQKLQSLDGLRGIAAFSVLISHLLFAFYTYAHIGAGTVSSNGFEQVLFHSPFTFFYRGNFAVAIFFVISGFVLSRTFLEQHNISQLQNSSIKRYFRLGIPVFFSVFLSYLIINLNLYPSREGLLDGWLGTLFVHPASLSSALKEGIYGAMLYKKSSYNYVLWTIHVEFIGSMLLFGYLALFSHFRHSWAIGIIICIMMTVSMNINGLYYSLFIIGAHLNQLPRIKSIKLVVPIGLVFSLYLGGYHWRSDAYLYVVQFSIWIQTKTSIVLHWPVFYPCLGAVILVYLTTKASVFDFILDNSISNWLGRNSYAIYLMHPLVLSSVGAYVFIYTLPIYGYSIATFLTGIIFVIVTFIVSEVFVRWVDLPSITWATRFSNWMQKK